MKKILKKIYFSFPFKKQIFEAIRSIWVPSHSIYKHLYFTGVIKIKADDKASFKMMHYGTEIENDFFWKGITNGWEKISMKYWIELSRSAKIVLDIGANTGVYSLTTKAINPTAQVYAFEPLKKMFKKLELNKKLNKYNIDCIEKAASDKSGKAIIYENGSDHLAAATLNAETKLYSELNIETEIETITLDDFIGSNNIGKIDLVKMDVETHEPNVLDGYRHLLSIHRPDFLIEVLTDEVGTRLQQIFQDLGYYYFNIDDKMGTIRKTDVITKSDYFNYLVCTKESAIKLRLI